LRSASASITSTWRWRLDEHSKLLDLMEAANRECIDVKVVPDLLQFIALRARSRTWTACPSSTSTTCRCRASTPG
jgi:hypothetical protein